MPVDFANEVLRLWMEFEAKLETKGDKKLGELARDKRKAAIESANCVVNCAVGRTGQCKLTRHLVSPGFRPSWRRASEGARSAAKDRRVRLTEHSEAEPRAMVSSETRLFGPV